MITGELRSKVDKIWEIFWTGGITNPLTVIEQFTYLLFIKGLDDKQRSVENDEQFYGNVGKKTYTEDQKHLRWHHFKNLEPETLYDVFVGEVFPFIKNLHGEKDSAFSTYMNDAIFMIPTPQMLDKIITNIEGMPFGSGDTKGDLYEYLLSKVASAGTNGQFRTPRHIINMMVELMQPTPEDTIVDPAAGTAGFLVGAVEYLKAHHIELFHDEQKAKHFNEDMFYGFDMDRTMLRIGAMNMMLHDVENPNIMRKDSLSQQNTDKEKYSLVLANPPFKGSLDHESVASDLTKVTKTKKTELLFLALILRMLKIGGRSATIVPDGVLFGSSNAHKSIRKEIVENHQLQAIISMPSGVFKPYAGVSTAIMIFTKTGTGGTDNVWFYDMKADGYSLDDKRQPVETNDISDIISRYHNLQQEKERKRTDQSFLVPVQHIIDNDYDLSINRYKEIEYEEVVYEKPEVILHGIEDLEEKIRLYLDEIKEMI